MYILAKIIQIFFPLAALMFLILGIKGNAIKYVISSLWLSLIAVLIHFEFAGNQIFGTYFDYINATVYTLTLFVLLISLIRVITHLCINSPVFRYAGGFINSFLIVSALLVITNLWINAFFIENKKPGTPIMQVALFDKPQYCDYKYIFYKVTTDDSIMYLCPDHYGLIASTGHLSTIPDFVTKQLHLSVKEKNDASSTLKK